jgi:hypothetical protein
MGGRWGPDGPPPDAYSRVTNPQRFAPVVDAADALVVRLVERYEVTAQDVPVATLPESSLPGVPRLVRAVRLLPRAGACLVVAITDFPGVRLWFGHWASSHAPTCGCDACDEDAQDAIEELTRTVADVVAGRFRERLSRHPRRLWTAVDSGYGWSAIDRPTFDRLATLAPAGEHHWPPWPLRDRNAGSDR